MSALTATLVMICVMFMLLTAVKPRAKWVFCSICLAVSATWITLLSLSWLGQFADPTLTALLMGQSVVGIYYLAERHTRQEWLVFRLPFLLTLTTVAYFAVARTIDVLALAWLVILWAIFAVIYWGAGHLNLRRLGFRLIECCRNW